MTDPSRLLDVLLHDLRAPLGVAHGYLRLVREQRLGTEEERERALDRTQDALARMSRLCDEASALVAIPATAALASVGVDHLTERVEARLESSGHAGLSRLHAPAASGAHVQVRGDAGRLADAIADILQSTLDGEAPAVRTSPNVLVFSGGPAAAGDGADEGGHETEFDPWRRRTARQGLALPLACGIVEHAGGTVVTTNGRDVVISLPLETDPE